MRWTLLFITILLLLILVFSGALIHTPAATTFTIVAVVLAFVFLTRGHWTINPLAVYLWLFIACALGYWGVMMLSRLGPLGVLLLVIALAVPVVIGMFTSNEAVARRREERGLCPRCGYDLRATPDRCPECSAPVPDTIVRRRRRRSAQKPPPIESDASGQALPQPLEPPPIGPPPQHFD